MIIRLRGTDSIFYVEIKLNGNAKDNLPLCTFFSTQIFPLSEIGDGRGIPFRWLTVNT